MSEDFRHLYAQLGLHANCSLGEFKQACRRRIGRQHPDRVDAPPGAEHLQMPLHELLGLYAKALRFHRRHGRLPGATRAWAADEPGGFGISRGGPPDDIVDVRGANPGPQSLRSALWLLVPAIGATLLVIGLQDDQSPARPLSIQASPTLPHTDDGARAADRLEIGMDTDTVLSIQGEPMQRDGAEWLYGPSWLRFDGEHLVDWYSSPLHALRTRSQSPPEEIEDAPR